MHTAYSKIVQWLAGAIQPLVNIPLLSGEDTGNAWLSVSLKNRVSTATDFVGTAASPQLIDGNQTKRFKLPSSGSLGRYQMNQLFIRSVTPLGAPSVAVRIFVAADSSLIWDDSNGEAQVPSWQEYKFWKRVMNDLIQSKAGGVKDSTDPSANLVDAATGVEVQILGYALGASVATDAGLQLDDASANFDPEWPIGADGGLVVMAPDGRYLYQTPANKGVQIGKSGLQEVAGQIWYDTHPKIWTAADKIAIWAPRTEVIGIEFVGTGTPGTDKLSFHVRHVGFH